MSTAEILARLKAWESGSPQPRGSTIAWPRAEDNQRLVIAFVRMAGESLPWGVAIGKANETPVCFTITEPRDYFQNAELVLNFGKILLDFFRHPASLTQALREAWRAKPELLHASTDRLQVWLPGPSHVEMFHFIDFRHTMAATDDETRTHQVRTIGRTCGWLFRESTRPGQVRVFDATARLRSAFSFPADDTRQAHLGFLLAWLDASGDRQAHQTAARQAEQLTTGVTMDPAYERDVLDPLLVSFRAAADSSEKEKVSQKIRDALEPELLRRWNQTVAAIRVFDADRRVPNPQLAPIIQLSGEEFEEQLWLDEARVFDTRLPAAERRPFGRHPESDFEPARAARRYFEHLHSFELANSELVHGDTELLEQALVAGNAFRGTIRTVVNQSPNRRAIKAHWTLECSPQDSLRLREDSKICLIGNRKRMGRILSIANDHNTRIITVEITDGVTGKSVSDGVDADDSALLVGRDVIWIDDGGSGISKRKSRRLQGNGPGAWLTHAIPAPLPPPPAVIRPDLLNFVESLR